MINISIMQGRAGGFLAVEGHGEPALCAAVCCLEDALIANLSAKGKKVVCDRDEDFSITVWGRDAKEPVEFVTVAFMAMAQARAGEINLEVKGYDDSASDRPGEASG